MGKILLSFSSLDTYEFCGWKYHLKFQKRIKPFVPIRYPLVTGVAFHELVNKMYEVCDFDIKFLTKNWQDYFMRALDTEGCSFASTKGYEKYLAYGYGLIRKFHTFAKDNGYLVKPIATEWSHKSAFRDAKLMVKVDLIVQRKNVPYIELLDFKTGWKLPSQEDTDKSKQLTIYDMQARKELGLRNTKVGLFYPRRSKVLLSIRNSEDFKAVYKDLIDHYNAIKRNDLKPNFEGCKKCEYASRCEKYQKKFVTLS